MINMEKRIKESFSKVSMPEHCSEKIEIALGEEKNIRGKTLRRIAMRAAAAAAAVILVVLGVIYAEPIRAFAEEKGFFPTIKTQMADKKDGEERKQPELIGYIVESKNGRLYLNLINREIIDVTDLCSMEKAYIHTIVDSVGITHYIYVGGTPDNFGYGEFMRDLSKTEEPGWGWCGGNDVNHWNKETDDYYQWIYDVKEQLKHPYPIP